MSELNDVKELTVSIEQIKKVISFADAVEQLENSRLFKKVIELGYYKEEAERLAMTKASPSMQDDETQAAIIKSIDGIGSLFYFLHDAKLIANQVRGKLPEAEAMLREADLASDA